MKRRLAAAVWALALASPLFAHGAPVRPVIEVPSLTHDFGVIFEQKSYVHTFAVHNRGTADLLIESVNPSCGCSTVEFDRVIAPGESGRVELAIDGAQVHGEFRKTAAVVSNDPDHPHVTLTVAGNEIPYVNVAPAGTVALHGRSGEPVEQELVISSNEQNLDFKVLAVTSTMDDKITWALDEGANPGEYSLKLYKNPRLPTASTYGSVLVHTSSAHSPVTTVQVHVMTKGSIVLSPAVLNYGAVRFAERPGQETPATRSVMLARSGGNFRIKDVTLSNPNYRAVVDELAPGQQYRVQVTFTPPVRKAGRQQTESGEMIIHTDDPREPAVRVQLLARAQ